MEPLIDSFLCIFGKCQFGFLRFYLPLAPGNLHNVILVHVLSNLKGER